jgi:hypothetical protein
MVIISQNNQPDSSFDRQRQRGARCETGGAVCPKYGRGIQPVPVKRCITTTRNARKAERSKTMIASLVRVGCPCAAIAQNSMRKASDLSREQSEFRILVASLRLSGWCREGRNLSRFVQVANPWCGRSRILRRCFWQNSRLQASNFS